MAEVTLLPGIRQTARVACGLGLLMVVAGVGAVLVKPIAGSALMARVSEPKVLGVFPFTAYQLRLVFQIGLGMVVLVSGLGLWRYEAWPRRILEVSSWVLAVDNSVRTLTWFTSSLDEAAPYSLLFRILGLVIGIAWTGAFVWAAMFLRSRRFREALQERVPA